MFNYKASQGVIPCQHLRNNNCKIMAKYIVTGGLGFIGSRLANHLNGSGHEVLVIDNGIGDFQRKLNLGIVVLNYNLAADALLLPPEFRENVDCIFHLAGVSSVKQTEENPILANECNVTATLKVIQLAKSLGAKVVFSSSAAVYGDAGGYYKSDGLPEGVMSPIGIYGAQKYMSEWYLRVMDVEHTILRFFNVFGADDKKGVIGVYRDALRNKEPLVIRGDGEQTRDYIWVDDVKEALITASERREDLNGETINIGSGEAVSVNELVDYFQYEHEKIYVMSEGVDIKHSKANTEKAEKLLGLKTHWSVKGFVRSIEV